MEYREIAGYPNYRISDKGDVWSVPSKRLRKNQLLPSGHYCIALYRGGEQRMVGVHLLVAEAFIGPRPPGHETRHLDGNPANNDFRNLAYGTKSENAFDMVAHGVHNNARKTHCKNGHEFTPENTYMRPRGKGRDCKTCLRSRNEKYAAGLKVPRPPKTHCPAGHEYTPENTQVRPNGTRYCRVCCNRRRREKYQLSRKTSFS